MKNTLFLITVLMLAFSISSQGQTIKELATSAADGLCSCANETYSDIDNDVKRAMARIIKYQMKNDEEGMNNYVAQLPMDLADRLTEQASIMEENSDLFQMCINDMEASMGELDFEEDQYNGITEDEFALMIVESMKEMMDCTFASIIMELGLEMQKEEMEDNKGQVKISTIKSSGDYNENREKNEGTGGN